MFQTININNYEIVNDFLAKHNIQKLNNEDFNNNPFMKVLIYIFNNNIIGYLNYSIMYEKAELNQILVDTEYRNNGIGSILLKYFLDQCNNCTDITLEVKKSNIPAIKLYEKYGFVSVAVRKNYYGNVDGLLMVYERGE